MPKIARGRGTGASSSTPVSGSSGPPAGGPAPGAGGRQLGPAGRRAVAGGEQAEHGGARVEEGDGVAAHLAGGGLGGAGRQERGELHAARDVTVRARGV